MSQWARYIQKAPKILKTISSKGSREGRIEGIIPLIGAPNKPWWSAPIKAWWIPPRV